VEKEAADELGNTGLCADDNAVNDDEDDDDDDTNGFVDAAAVVEAVVLDAMIPSALCFETVPDAETHVTTGDPA
jgi:hypothetical protein